MNTNCQTIFTRFERQDFSAYLLELKESLLPERDIEIKEEVVKG